MRRMTAIVACWLLVLGTVGLASEEGRLLRFPDIHQDKITFSYGGDIWVVPTAGGLATKLTSADGLELFPRFSPDGEQIAFTGQYDGDLNVYVMPADGGPPRRLTYHPGIRVTSERMGPESIVMDWTPDGSKILFRSREEKQDVWEGRLYLVSPNGGYRQPLPLPRGGFASFNADASKIAYCPIFRDFRTWKRYKGGAAQDVWIYDFNNRKSEKITDWVGTDNMPMWDKTSGLIYFNSDRTGTLNLYSYNPETKQTLQVTKFTDYDVRWPAMGPGAIVFENGGYLYVLDLPDGTPRKVNIELSSDLLLARPRYVNCDGMVNDFTVSPDGKRAIFGARGDIFTVPAKHGNTRNLTNTSDANEKYSTISPDAKWIAYVSDASGEDELYLITPDGKGDPIRLTTDGYCYRYQPVWSPDSKKLAWSNKNTQLKYIDIDTKKVVTFYQNRKGDIRNYTWSPDSRWIAYSTNNDHSISVVYIYSLDDGQIRPVTNGSVDDHVPVFDPEGKYLYFLSERNFNPILGNYEFNYVLDKSTEIIVTVLSADGPSPFAPQSDEVESSKPETSDKGDKDKKKDDDKGKDKAIRVNIDFDGIFDRQAKLPIEPGSYGNMAAAKGRLFYMSYPMRGLAGQVEDAKRTLHVFDFEKREASDFLVDVGGYELTPDGKKMIVSLHGKHEIIDAGGDKAKTGDNVLDLSEMRAWVDFDSEWHQIFNEVWRMERDYFYDSLMYGLDWPGIRDRYAPLVDHVAHRFDLTYVLGEMISELDCSHTYVGGGDMPDVSANSVGLLGINWVIDSAAQRFRIGKILEGQNWKESRRSPLTEPGIKAAVGDYVLAINGKPLTSAIDPYSLLEHAAGDIATLKLAKTPDGKDSWTVDVKTIASEADLRYHDWVAHNRHLVDSISGGVVGYVHIPDMGTQGMQEFSSQFFPQIRKQAMIIDVRYNGGGFTSQLVIERLRRVLGGLGIGRNTREPYTYPGTVFTGHLACLINEHSCSDGDIFPYHFRGYGLGPLIGTRTWGGVVGIRGHRPLVDGGFITTPEFAKYTLDRKWSDMENHGVEPDIEVQDLPEDMMRGHDAQIERAVTELMREVKEDPRKLPAPPSAPPKERQD